MMELLTKFSPAETYLIKDNNEATYKELLKLTIADLLLKKVIKVANRKMAVDDPEEKYILRGVNYTQYQAKDHEKLLISTWTTAPDLEVHFKDFIKTCYQNGRSFKYFGIEHTLKPNNLYDHFQQGFWKKLLGTLKLNESGIALKAKLDKEIEEVQQQLTTYMQEDKTKALEILSKIYGNIYLISGLTPEILKEIEEELNNQSEYSDSDYYAYDTYWLWYASDSDYDYNADFDSAFDSADSSDSGCSGDGGGDSGCSGCGGD